MNKNSPAIKRILADVRELSKHPSSRYHAAPLEDNMFEWHFTIRGAKDTDFEGGIYHGRILLPVEYPFKPPNIIFLNKNGRFEVGTKICLSISAYHVETWQPAWGVRTMLEAIISFLPTPGEGAIGALDWTKEERQALARESHSFQCPLCGAIDELIPTPEGTEENEEEAKEAAEIQAQIAQIRMTAPPPSAPSTPASTHGKSVPATPSSAGTQTVGAGSPAVAAGSVTGSVTGTPASPTVTPGSAKRTPSVMGTVSEASSPSVSPITPGTQVMADSELESTAEETGTSEMDTKTADKMSTASAVPAAAVSRQRDSVDLMYTVAMAVVAMLIAYLLAKKYYLGVK